MATFRSDECRTKSLALYNKQIKKLDMPFSDIYINTSFGRTHLFCFTFMVDRVPLQVLMIMHLQENGQMCIP